MPRAGRTQQRQQCLQVAALYDEVERFRSTVDMKYYRFGACQYRSSTVRSPSWSPSCAARSTHICCPSPGTGPQARQASAVAGHAPAVAGHVPPGGADQAHPILLRYRQGERYRPGSPLGQADAISVPGPLQRSSASPGNEPAAQRSRAPARGGAARLRPTVVAVNTAKEDTMTRTLLDYSATMAELHIAELRREAEADRKVRAALAARRRRGV